ncbi:conserved hypothetical protein [Leadbettera azotonutricia ZAS-9]|uniref:6-hydroxymethylpterin diphosphokinase MptE-like domain-containing protein n=1 Tax=Leadbettera azotonutricia (strain ATCC BAA-888 / DSM 13862 / ZAS-9) TaxID=545695 RepID=F5Y7C1_LEAAZ|nr:conserved hypothetical protein [Leadbettera azotonutricia ZAS-9]
MPRELPARRGFSVTYLGKALLSRIDPIAQAERLVSALPVKDRTLYLCPSPLYGYGLDLLLGKLGNNSVVLCIEADEQLYDLSVRNMGALLGRAKSSIALVKAGSGAGPELCRYVRSKWGERRFRRVEMLRLSMGWQLFPEAYSGIAEDLRSDMATGWGNAMTLIKLGRLYARNAVRNLRLLPRLHDISSLDYGGSPVLVLGAGPSLDKVLDGVISFFGDKALQPESRPFRIICADTCIPCLKDRSIMPDLVAILESQHWNLRDFSGVSGWGASAALDLSSLPASARVLAGKAYIFMTPWTGLRLFNRLAEKSLLPTSMSPMGSVGLTAVELARLLSGGPIITGGIDFSFTMDSYHARSSPGHLYKLASLNRFASPLNAAAAFRQGCFPVQSKSGIPVRSDPAMRNYRELFEQEFSKDSGIFDIEGPGLALGVRTLTLDKAVRVLAQGTYVPCNDSPAPMPKANLNAFIEQEKNLLLRLRDYLTGTESGEDSFDGLLDECDYLWAHFPECAGTGGRRPPSSDLSFLKRVRAEIDPFIKLWDMTLREIENI